MAAGVAAATDLPHSTAFGLHGFCLGATRPTALALDRAVRFG